MADCMFCKIVNGEQPSYKVYEDENTFAFLDIFPVAEGHVQVVPKTHADNLLETAPEDAAALVRTVQTIAPKILEAVGADGFNLGVNNGESAGQVVHHTHFHLMPRKTGTPRTFEHMPMTPEQLQELHTKIKRFL